MELHEADMSKAQVVYYLSKSGTMEPPHMMDVPHSSHAGLRLKDVKQRLAVLRGGALPNMFSWSYKRSYNNKYIWQDVSEDDVIVPGRDGEYILKASELIDDCEVLSDKMMKYTLNPDAVNHKIVDIYQSKFRGAEIWVNKEKKKSDSQEPPSMRYAKFNNFSQGKVSPTVQVRSKQKMIDNFIRKNSLEAGVSTGSDESQMDRKISSSRDCSDSSPQKSADVEVCKRSSPVLAKNRSCLCDVATQTEENDWRDATASRYHASSASEMNVHKIAFSNQSKVFDQKNVHETSQAEASLLSMISGKLDGEQSFTSSETGKCDLSQHKQSTKSKHTSASRVILQILSRGGIDTKVQNVFSKKEVKPEVSKTKKFPRRQLSHLLQGFSSPTSHAGSKPVTPKSIRSPESLSSRMGTPIAHSCELDVENSERNETFTLSIPPSAEICLMTALPSPSYDTQFSKSNKRCSSFSSRMSSRSQKFKNKRTTFDTLCKASPAGPSASAEDNIKQTSASRGVSPIHLFSVQKNTIRESWTSLSQRVYPSQATKPLNFTENFQQLRSRPSWRDSSTVKEVSQLAQASGREYDKSIKGQRAS